MSYTRANYSAYPEAVHRPFSVLKVGNKERRVYHDAVKGAQAMVALAGLPSMVETTIRIYDYKTSKLLHEEQHDVASREEGMKVSADRLSTLMSSHTLSAADRDKLRQERLGAREGVIKESGLTEEECVALGIVAKKEDVQ